MWNDYSCYKRFAFYAIIVFVLLNFSFFGLSNNFFIAYAEDLDINNEINENIDNILGDIATENFDEYLVNDFDNDFFKVDSFKDLVLKILSGEFFSDFNSLSDYFLSNLKSSAQLIFSFLLTVFIIVVLYELFACFCFDKYFDLKNNIKFIFSIVLILFILQFFISVRFTLEEIIIKIFNFASTLFPVLLGLMLSSGAVSSFSVYSSLSAFLLTSVLYIFRYFLMPLSIGILVFSLFDLIIKNGQFEKLTHLLKYIFKSTIALIFGVFGLFSVINVVSSGMKDGLSLKVAKFAIKNYIPILGGYISEGFDFVKTCSVLVKNAFGLGGIFLLLFMIIKPLILYFVYVFGFKILSILTSFIGNKNFANVFEKIAQGFSYLLVVLIGLFLIMIVFIFLMIISVSVV